MDTDMAPMLVLYMRTGCPFSARVVNAMRRMGLRWEERNLADAGMVEELLDRGGKTQTPYLVDREADIEMYESEDIVAHLAQMYGRRQRQRAAV